MIASPPPTGLAGITLRPLVGADVPEWLAYLSIPELIEHTSWDVHGAESLGREYESAEPRGASPASMSVVRRSPARSACTCSAGRTAGARSPTTWRRSIAPAVGAAVTRWSFATLALQRMQATVVETNTRSERALERCGFACEGLLRGYRLVRGRPGNFRMLARLSGERACT